MILPLPNKPNVFGINARLERAKQNIRYLDVEVRQFLESGEYPAVLPYENKKVLREGAKYHERRAIPSRFSVLAGEIIHHLRSCLDHLIWEFSSESYKARRPTHIEFPVFEVIPSDKSKRAEFARKIKGIRDPGALILIEAVQPYYTTNPIASSLSIIHKMDIMDKHRTLLLCGATMSFNIPIDLFNRFMSYQRGEPGSFPVDVGAEFKRNPNIYAQVAFKEFGVLRNEPIIQGLNQLYNYVVLLVKKFHGLSEFAEIIV